MVKLQIISDTHLEFRGENFQRLIKPSAPILCMVGDICACGTDSDFRVYKEFIKYLAPKFKYIFHIPGNHEYYTSGNKNITYEDTIPGINKKIQNYLKSFNNIFFLNDSTVKLNIDKKTYIFIGTALWTGIRQHNKKKIESMMNDYNSIYMPCQLPKKSIKSLQPVRKFTVDDMSKIHIKSLKYIKKEMSKIKPDEIGIVLTHHKPYRSASIEKIITQAYETDIIGTIIKSPHRVKLFVYGHTHVADDSQVDGVRVVSNPKGYPSQKTRYKNDFVVGV
jgi:predicted phosphodiesterase